MKVTGLSHCDHLGLHKNNGKEHWERAQQTKGVSMLTQLQELYERNQS